MRLSFQIEKGVQFHHHAQNIKRQMNKTEQHKKAILEALEKSLGVVTTACKSVGVGRTTFYGWYDSDEVFKKAVDDIANVTLDFAESQLHKQIKEGSTAATIFYLKTKGKKRGYIEITKLQHEGGDIDKPVQVISLGSGKKPE